MFNIAQSFFRHFLVLPKSAFEAIFLPLLLELDAPGGGGGGGPGGLSFVCTTGGGVFFFFAIFLPAL